MSQAILLISSADQRGITATVSGFVYEHNGNVIHADQHIDEQSNTFFMRIQWSLEGFGLSEDKIEDAFKPIAEKFNMHWELHFTDQKIKSAIFVSQHLHCLHDLLYRHSVKEINCEIPLIISNHPDASSIAKDFGIDYVHLPITEKSKVEQEKKQLELLKKKGVDLIILARYHQILSPEFVQQYEKRIINIHHSFLPAFPGKNPYAQAYQKGVKIIGATSHYVTDKLDEGPIIEQDTTRVSHRDSLQSFKRKGNDLERVVLSRAIRWHLEHKILSYDNKTVIFD